MVTAIESGATVLGCGSLPLEKIMQELLSYKARGHSGDSSTEGETLKIIQHNSAVSDKYAPEVLTFLAPV